jgi:hypothetical protein
MSFEFIVPQMEEGAEKESCGGEVNSNMTYLIHCKNFYKCHNVSPPNTIIKEKKIWKNLYQC